MTICAAAVDLGLLTIEINQAEYDQMMLSDECRYVQSQMVDLIAAGVDQNSEAYRILAEMDTRYQLQLELLNAQLATMRAQKESLEKLVGENIKSENKINYVA